MKPILCLFFLLLAGCAETTRISWSKPGATADDFRRDQTECEVNATRDVPVRESSIPIFGSTTNCSRRIGGAVECVTTPGYAITDDENSNLRMRAYIVCLERRGYTPTVITPETNYSPTRPQDLQATTMECKSDKDCIRGESCRSKKGGGTECRASEKTPVTRECESNRDCAPTKSCRSITGGGTECR